MKKQSENIDNKNEFKVPINYFNNIEDSIFSKLSESDLLNNDEFKVPNNYFETIENNVFSKLNIDNTETKVISIKRIILQISVAAIILISGILYYNNINKVMISQIASNDIENWLDDNIDTFDTYTITDVINNYEINELQNFNDNELLDQLEGEDIESILDEITNY